MVCTDLMNVAKKTGAILAFAFDLWNISHSLCNHRYSISCDGMYLVSASGFNKKSAQHLAAEGAVPCWKVRMLVLGYWVGKRPIPFHILNDNLV